MRDNGLPFTPFVSDRTDQARAVWDKVFFNLDDYGSRFAQDNPNWWVPNPFGPISLRIAPDALRPADDLAVTLCSASHENYDREEWSLTSIEEFEGIFFGDEFSSALKSSRRLQIDYDFEQGSNPELSATYGWDMAVFGFVKEIIVDPYPIQGRKLVEWVEEQVAISNFSPAISRKLPRYRGGFLASQGLFLGLARFGVLGTAYYL